MTSSSPVVMLAAAFGQPCVTAKLMNPEPIPVMEPDCASSRWSALRSIRPGLIARVNPWTPLPVTL